MNYEVGSSATLSGLKSASVFASVSYRTPTGVLIALPLEVAGVNITSQFELPALFKAVPATDAVLPTPPPSDNRESGTSHLDPPAST
jgi:hypothetical protein